MNFKRSCLLSFVLLALTVASPLPAQTLHHGSHGAATTANPYQGQQARAITSLSSEDMQALQNGEGWGLAKPAEFNGVPGPLHLLELANEIGLSAQQKQQITKLYDDMKAQAIALGEEYIASERAIDEYFRAGKFSDRELRQRVDQAEQARANLRFLHLSYHHKTLDVVSADQVDKYNELRGYSQTLADPCNNVPPGHNEAMFRKHMGCD